MPAYHSWKWDVRDTRAMLYSTPQTKQCLTDLMLQQLFDSIECLFGVCGPAIFLFPKLEKSGQKLLQHVRFP